MQCQDLLIIFLIKNDSHAMAMADDSYYFQDLFSLKSIKQFKMLSAAVVISAKVEQ